MKVCWKSNNGHARKGAEVHSPVASEATPWVKCAVELAPCKGKSVETECVMFTFALAGRTNDNTIIPRVSLRLPWAEEVIGLSARLGCQGYTLPFTFQPTWVVRAIRYHLLFSPLGLSGTRRVPHALDMRKIWKSEGSVGDN